MNPVDFRCLNNEIVEEAKRIAKASGREKGNFEDQIRVATELLRGMEIIASANSGNAPDGKQVSDLRSGLTTALQSFASSILDSERGLVSAATKQREQAVNYLISFLMSFASRSGTRERLQLFTTNYDRYIEAGADVAGLRLIDRFVGTLAPVFRASRLDVDLHYNPPGIRGEPRYLEGVVRFTKLHGSVDWLDYDDAVRRIGLPFGSTDTAPFLSAAGLEGVDATRIMIYPNAAKDRETASYPYVELFRDFAAAICRPNSTLVCYGYSFGDEHINRVIEDMLTIPSSHLVVIAHDDPLKRIMRTYERLGRHAQITLLIGNHLGDLLTLVDNYLPKPAIDRTTFRMAELLKARWGTEPRDYERNKVPSPRRGRRGVMTQTPIEQAENLRVGTVDFVSPDEIKVALDIEAPESVALNTGGPRPFPRVNGYLLISVDEAFLVWSGRVVDSRTIGIPETARDAGLRAGGFALSAPQAEAQPARYASNAGDGWALCLQARCGCPAIGRRGRRVAY